MRRKILSLSLALLMASALLVMPGITPKAYADGDVAINDTNFPDSNFRTYVKDNFDADKNGSLSTTEINSATEIDVSKKSIANLKGVEYFTALRILHCQDNRLEALDVSKNTALLVLWCDDNQLTTLDVSKNTSLLGLSCHNNNVQSSSCMPLASVTKSFLVGSLPLLTVSHAKLHCRTS